MFGAGTDYALLIVSRYPRRAAAHRRRRRGDRARAPSGPAPAILASGGIVVAAMLVLGLADFNATREMGPILALGIVVMMAAGLTLLPALLAAFGRRAFWPAIPPVEPDYRPGDTPGWRRVGALVRRRPWLLVGRLARDPRRSARSATSKGRGYLDAHRAVPRPRRSPCRASS